MAYVDGYVLAVPTKNKAAYIDLAALSAQVFKEYGATEVVECWGEDIPEGEVTSFPMAVKCGADETVVFSWIIWPSKSHRDINMEKAMADPRFDVFKDNIPFDGKRMIFGGFESLLGL